MRIDSHAGGAESLDIAIIANRQQLEADFRAWLDGFSPNVRDILDNFEIRNLPVVGASLQQ